MNILITGPTGFIGREIINSLKSIYSISALTNTRGIDIPGLLHVFYYDDLNNINFDLVLKNINVVIHCSGIAHKKVSHSSNSFLNYKFINVDLTDILSYQCSLRGVKFIHLSSASIYKSSHGIITENFDTNLLSGNYYIKSKIDAELAIIRNSELFNLKYLILRLPVVYGIGCGGNFLKLVNLLIYSRIPLNPFGNFTAMRSILGVNNLIECIKIILIKGDYNNEIYNIADKETYSISNICNVLCQVSLVPRYKFFFPQSLILFFFNSESALFQDCILSTDKFRKNYEVNDKDTQINLKIIYGNRP